MLVAAQQERAMLHTVLTIHRAANEARINTKLAKFQTLQHYPLSFWGSLTQTKRAIPRAPLHYRSLQELAADRVSKIPLNYNRVHPVQTQNRRLKLVDRGEPSLMVPQN